MRKTTKTILSLFLLLAETVMAWADGTTYTNEAATITFAMTDKDNPGAYTTSPTDGFSTVAFDYDNTKMTVFDAGQNITGEDGKSVGVTGIRFESSDASGVLSWFVRPASGLTFTPTKVSGYVNRDGTDAQNAIIIKAYKADGDVMTLGTYTARRMGKSSSQDKYGTVDNAIYKYEITLTADQQTALAGTDGFYLTSTVGVGSSKNKKKGLFGQVTIEGTLNGTMAEVEKYTVSLAAAPTEGGTVSKYPNSDTHLGGDVVTLTATENFGYDFVNWTDGNNTVLSTDATYKHTVTASANITANFKKVNTYALNISLTNGANDYMVTLSPEPTVVDGKNMYEAGTEVTLTAASNAILTFNGWSDGTSATTTTVTMSADQNLTANYTAGDYLAAWDFIEAGNQNRTADYADVDNTSTTLTMRDADGNTYGWLDKSQKNAGGYVGRPAAVNWHTGSAKGDVGICYWQTTVNATAYTDITVTTAMTYNYNAYQTQLVQYSLDGENWSDAGSITIAKAKQWTDAEFKLPAACNNQPALYLRWISDKTSTVDGAAAEQDGITLGATFITGTPQIALAMDHEYTTFCSTRALDFSTVTDATAYTAAMNDANDAVVLTPVTKVPANEGVVIKRNNTATTAAVPVIAAADALTGNQLVGVTEAGTVKAEDLAAAGNAYLLYDSQFHKIGSNATGTMAAGKAYLSVPQTNGAKALRFVIDGATAITDAVAAPDANDNAYYNLQGMRIAKPAQKGLYIVNGRAYGARF